ncbi:MAG: nicotinate (nicotinamide) nucleotide adenylyltransferase [Pseudomonadota bacterium]
MFTPPTLLERHRWDGMRIGLLGGSFNPPHIGHLHIARLARAKFNLDFVWWIVTPQNPLKDKKGMAPYKERFKLVDEMLKQSPRQIATHLEAEFGTEYTHETIEQLRRHFPKTEFVWICGMDNAHIFHKWDEWRKILHMMPICFIARPPADNLVRVSPLRQYQKIPHYFKTKGPKTNLKKNGVYWLKSNKMLDISSTKIRNKNKLFQ